MTTTNRYNGKLIGLTGKARSGKDTVGNYLVQYRRFQRMAFADPLKLAMAVTFGLGVLEFHDDKLKDEVDVRWGITRRQMLQRGADAIRAEFGQSHYINLLLHSYQPVAGIDNVVITDVRSDAEAEAIRDLGGVIILIHRDGVGLTGSAAAHHTENGVSDKLIDRIIVNNYDKAEAYVMMDIILNEEFS